MRVRKTTALPTVSGGGAIPVKEVAYDDVGLRAQQTIGVAAVFLGGTAVFKTRVTVRNVSTAGQIIRIGDSAVSFGAPPFGVSLYPGDSAMVDNFESQPDFTLWAIADAAGGLLDVLQVQTSV